MITRLALYKSASHEPYFNLAVEQHLLETVKPGQCILYLWQNENTVVIGRNQNPWNECRTTLLAQEGGHLARRLSGGGAVFHDLGNLNFTFLMPQEDFDIHRQLSVILRALDSLNIHAERSGRNDILAQDRKFSGNAYYKNGRQAYHHGTLLVDADMEKLSRYLNPSRAKLASKGVSSVRSRVVNLSELNPQITVERLSAALVDSFSQVYGLPAQTIPQNGLDTAALDVLAQRNRSWEWNYGQKLPFTGQWEARFPWGSIQIQLQVESGVIRQAKVYSDAMDWRIGPELEHLLPGCRLHPKALRTRLEGTDLPAEEICQLFD